MNRIPIVRKERFDDPAWLFELKYDGFRGITDTIRSTSSLPIRSSKMIAPSWGISGFGPISLEEEKAAEHPRDNQPMMVMITRQSRVREGWAFTVFRGRHKVKRESCR
jgi:hypothetical protein